jgi:phospholipase C
LLKHTAKQLAICLRTGTVALVVFQMAFGQALHTEAQANPRTPIKHVIIIVGENRTFDHVFATYKPKTGSTSTI